MVEKRDFIKEVAEALRGVLDPRTGADIISSGFVKNLRVVGPGVVGFVLSLPPDSPGEVAEQARQAVEAVAGVRSAEVEVRTDRADGLGGRKLPVMGQGGAEVQRPGAAPGPGPAPKGAPPQPQAIPGVRRVIAVSSGKGGVGKSTVATNLAAALASKGARVGLLDADVYGPDIPIMFGVYAKPHVTRDERVVPLEAHGVKLMSVGFLLDDDTPAIWRGPIVMGIIRQFLQQVEWGELDYLFVDMPPGTGDAQLSLVQLVKVDGSVLVTTPQSVATADVLKGIKMFERVEVPVLGLIENMSGFACPHCGVTTHVFGEGGGRELAATADVPFLGDIPLGASVVDAGDSGRPTVLVAPESPEAQAFQRIAQRVAAAVDAGTRHADAGTL